MNAKIVAARAATGLLSLTMLATSGGLALAAAGDYATRNVAPPGVTISGVDVGGLTRDAIRETVERSVVDPLLHPLTVRAEGVSFTLDPADYIFVDIDGAVTEAYELNRSSTIAARAVRLASRTPVKHAVEPRIEVDTEDLARTVTRFASEVDYDAVDARIAIEEGIVVIDSSAEGLRIDVDSAVEQLAAALLAGEDVFDLPTETVRPTVADEDLGMTIVVRLASRTLELYEGVEIDRTYRIAVGKPGYSTPRGSWEITAKRYRPSWGNPGSAWAADMPATIPPGPSNPLGTRAMNLNVSGIRIHGTSAVNSIGTAASHGCMRMVRRDVEELYDLVDVGTPVLIVSQ